MRALLPEARERPNSKVQHGWGKSIDVVESVEFVGSATGSHGQVLREGVTESGKCEVDPNSEARGKETTGEARREVMMAWTKADIEGQRGKDSGALCGDGR